MTGDSEVPQDPDAFERLFRERYGELCSFAEQFLGESHAAEDAVQSIMVRLWERRGSLTVRTTLRAYLYRAVRNHCLNVLKRSKIQDRVLAHEASDARGRFSVQPNLEGRMDKAAEASALRQAIASLPPRRRRVVELRWIHQLSHKEIAEILGISTKGVEIHLTRALKSLRRSFVGGDR